VKAHCIGKFVGGGVRKSSRKKVISKPVLCPLFDRSLSIIGYEPAMRGKDVITCMESYSEVERMNSILPGLIDYFGNRHFMERSCVMRKYP